MNGPRSRGQRDDRVGRDQLAVGRDQRVRDALDRSLAADELHARAIEQPGQRVGRDRPEHVERARLVRDDDDVRAVRELVRGHERELVERQQPAGLRGGDEDDARLGVADRRFDRARADRAAERGRAGHAVDAVRAGRDHQLVVAEPSAVGRAHLAPLGVDGRERPAMADDAQLGQSVERERAERERRRRGRAPRTAARRTRRRAPGARWRRGGRPGRAAPARSRGRRRRRRRPEREVGGGSGPA